MPFREIDDRAQRESQSGPSLNAFTEVLQRGSLRPLIPVQELDTKKCKFEILSAVMDSGATIPVINPGTGKAYEMTESAASRAGVEYEVANGDTLPNLGEKKMAVLTAEGTLRGYQTQCADVSKSLQAIRALVSSQHAVCFGLGDGTDHLVINKISGEVNGMRDDGVSYIQDMLIVPADKVEAVAMDLATAHDQDFTRQGR